MGKDTVIEVVLRLKDQMGGQARKALAELTQAAKGAGQGTDTAAKAVDALAKASQGASQGAGTAAQAMGEMGRIGENVARSAGGAARAVGEVGRKANALRSDKVRRMATDIARVQRESRAAKREMDGAAKSGDRLASALSRAGKMAKRMGGVATGAAGVAAVLAHQARAPIEYGKLINEMANTAFDSKGLARVRQGKAAIRKDIEAAALQGGDLVEVAKAHQAMVASGMDYGKARTMLPKVAYASSAAHGDPSEFATAAITAENQGFITADRADKLFAMIFKGGQLGSFEPKDMGRHLPGILSQAKGMQNEEGLASAIAALQVVRGATATPGEAATNMENLLKKLTSQDTQTHVRKNYGIDLVKSMEDARKHGVNPLEAFVNLMNNHIFKRDKGVLAAQKHLDAAMGTDKEGDARQTLALAKKAAMGKVLVDIEAQSGGMALVEGYGKYKEMKKEILGADASTMQTAHKSNEEEMWYKEQQAANKIKAGQDNIVEDVKGPVGKLMDAFNGAAQAIPGFSTAVVAATTAISAGVAGLVAKSGWNMITGGGAAVEKGLLAGGARSLARGASRTAPYLLGTGMAAYDIAQTENNPNLSRAQKNVRDAGAVGGAAGGMGGAYMGGEIGAVAGTAVVPVIGTAIGAALGAVLGGFIGEWSGRHTAQNLASSVWKPDQATDAAARLLVSAHQPTIKNEITVKVDGREVAKVVNEHNATEAKRH